MVLSTFFLLANIASGYSQTGGNDNYSSSFLTVLDGLSYNNVVNLSQDETGCMWISLFGGGLVRYDGSEYKTFRTDTPVPICNNFVTGTVQDDFERLWITTVKGIDALDLRTMTRSEITRDLPSGIDGVYCNSIVKTVDGAIWFCAASSVCRVSFKPNGDVDTFQTAKCSGSNVDDRQYLAELDNDGSVWTSVDGFITKVRYVQGKGLQMSDVNRFLYLGDDNKATAFVRKGETVWIGTNNGLFQIDQSTGEYKAYGEDKLLSPEITSLAVTHDGRIAVGTLQGLDIYNSVSDSFISYDASTDKFGNKALANNQIRCLKAVGDALWVGTDRDGVSIVRRKRLSVSNIRHRENDLMSIPDASIYSVLVDSKGRTWLGTSEYGLFLKLDDDFNFRGFNSKNSGLRHNSVKTMVEDGKGNIWLGTIGGDIDIVQPGEPYNISPVRMLSGQEPLDDINALYYDEINEFIWIATRSGLYYFDIERSALVRCQEGLRLCSGISRDAGNTLWIGHMSGVVSINLHTRELKDHPTPFFVLSTAVDSHNNLWLGSFDSGLYQYRGDNVDMPNYTVRDGLSDDNIRGLLSDGEFLWITTDRGLSRINVNSKEVRSFSVHDGVDMYNFCDNAVYRTKGASLYFGHMRGLTVLWSSAVPREEGIKARLSFTDGMAGDRPINLAYSDKVTVKQRERGFSFGFTDGSYGDVASVSYYARMYPLDKEWRKIDGVTKHIQYSGLPSGDYKLQVKAVDISGKTIGEAEKALVVKPVFFKTFAFFLLLFILSGSIVFYVMNARTRALQKTEERLRKEVEKQTMLLSEQKKQLEKRTEELMEHNRLLLKQNEELAGRRMVASTEQTTEGVASRDSKFVDKVMETIRGLYKDPELDVLTFCEAIGMSRSVLNTKIQESFGQSVAQFIRTYRLNVAKEILTNGSRGSMNISEIAYEIGFSDPKYFTRCFSKEFGVSPSQVLGEEKS